MILPSLYDLHPLYDFSPHCMIFLHCIIRLSFSNPPFIVWHPLLYGPSPHCMIMRRLRRLRRMIRDETMKKTQSALTSSKTSFIYYIKSLCHCFFFTNALLTKNFLLFYLKLPLRKNVEANIDLIADCFTSILSATRRHDV